MAPGSYINPTLNGTQHSVRGVLLSGAPSGFPAFNLQRTTGNDFYPQGSSLMFVIGAGADLSDGLQLSDLQGPDSVFAFDAREEGTGRYHPPLVQLNGDGTGSIQDSNNSGGVNSATMQEVNVNYGED